jgi:cation diffusion facilitator CzcD-associated flavoprotein CzcO
MCRQSPSENHARQGIVTDPKAGVSRRAVLATGIAAGAGLLFPAACSLGSKQAMEGSDASVGAPSDEISTDLLIIGAGPFGLALAAYVQERGLQPLVLGVPMGFWKSNMPQGMYLRSSCDWSLDPLNVHSIDAYLAMIGKRCADVEPLSRDFYLDYASWFQQEKGLRSTETMVRSLRADEHGLVAATPNGRSIRSRFMVIAIGFRNFANVPPELAAMLPQDRYAHTCDLVDFTQLKDKRVLIVGGRQSAFEWTALIREAGAEAIDVSYRHDTPSFTESDWGWVNPIVEHMTDDPGWYRRLSQTEKDALNKRFWKEGRLKLEPWLASRIEHENVRLHPRTNIQAVDAGVSGLDVTLDDGTSLKVDQVVLATGYKVDMRRVPFLADGLLSQVETRNGFPVLDDHFETSVPGLYATSLCATQDFGAFLAFTVSVRAQAAIIGRDIVKKHRSRRSASFARA